ncbi:MAG TPA: hypothetical protein VIW25_02830 [Nitrososphaeraceae archaeon]|jgi:hypothetical protein
MSIIRRFDAKEAIRREEEKRINLRQANSVYILIESIIIVTGIGIIVSILLPY